MKNNSWYCLLGNALLVLELNAASTPLVSHSASWQYHKGTNAPQTGWKTMADDALDATWTTGSGGFGYANNNGATTETNNCGTILSDMYNRYATLANTFMVDLSLGGTLVSNTTLYASNSPYTVSGSLTVPSGLTLAIEPGVTVRLRKNCGITVYGQLLADGTTNQPISFTRYPGDLNWERIMFVEAADSLLRNCLIQYANWAGDQHPLRLCPGGELLFRRQDR